IRTAAHLADTADEHGVRDALDRGGGAYGPPRRRAEGPAGKRLRDDRGRPALPAQPRDADASAFCNAPGACLDDLDGRGASGGAAIAALTARATRKAKSSIYGRKS